MPPKGRSSHHVQGGGGAALLAAERVLANESEYRYGIKKIQANAMMLADRIALGGEVEAALHNDDNDDDSAETAKFLKEQRDRLKALCEANMHGMREIDSFISAVSTVRDSVLIRQQQQQDDENETIAPDYEQMIRDNMTQYSSQQAQGGINSQSEDFLKQCCDRLGEKAVKKRKSGGRRSAAGDDEDDELEVVNNTTAGHAANVLKCPITGMLFEDPVRSRQCGHVYDRAGLIHHLRNTTRCPVAGCNNQNLTIDQMEDDEEVKMKVRQYRKRLQREQMENQSQNLKDHDEREDDDVNVNADRIGSVGMTIID